MNFIRIPHNSVFLILANNQRDALFRVFIYLFRLSTCFERHSAHHQEIEQY